MKLILLSCLLLASVLADKEAKIVNQMSEIEEDGSYKSSFETSNGITSEESGKSFPGSQPETGNYVRHGVYSYTWDGVTYTVNWTADENGYHAEGDHIPDLTGNFQHIGHVDDHL